MFEITLDAVEVDDNDSDEDGEEDLDVDLDVSNSCGNEFTVLGSVLLSVDCA